MDNYGLTKREQELLEPVVKISYGICESQEGFMQLVQMPECGGFDLTWADRLRKSIAKKNPAEYEKLTKEYFENARKKGLSSNLCNYVWNVLVATSRGYGFNKSHTLAYSLIALQEMNLAFKYPTIFWNCACLISDSGGVDQPEDVEEEIVVVEEIYNDTLNDFDVEESGSEDEEDDDEAEESTDTAATTKKKSKTKTADYDKIAKALGQIQSAGISISPPDINLSDLTFKPIPKEDKIIYGIKGITRVGDDLIKDIIAKRPYSSLQDFLQKVKVNKLQAVNLNSGQNSIIDTLVEKAINRAYDSSGTTRAIFNSDKPTTSILEKSVMVDSMVSTRILRMIENYINYELTKNVNSVYVWKFAFLETTVFNENDKQKAFRENLAVGGSRLMFLASTGMTPLEAIATLTFERNCNIDELLIPLQTSYTMSSDSSNNEGGAPEKETSELTEEGEKSQDKV